MKYRIQSVRVRATLGASIVVLAALVLAGIALVAALHNSQLNSIDDTLELRATDIESLLDGGAAPETIVVESGDTGFVQILDPAGTVVASSSNVDGVPPIDASVVEKPTTHSVRALRNDPYRIHVQPTDGAGRYTIVVGTTLEGLEKNQHALIGALVVGIPILLTAIAALVWFVIGRALHPVEAIRSRIAEIGGRELDQRVPVPLARDEIGRLAVTMNEMLDRLEDAHDRQANFVSDASHELRTPIAVIRTELEVALRAEGTDHWREVATEVLDEDLRMQRLVDDLLFIARHEGLVERHERALVDVDDVVLAELRRGTFTWPVDASDVSAGQVRGNPDHLARVIRNLLENADRHAHSRVAIHVTSAGGLVTVDVDDDGPGVPEADRELVFERFGRSDSARSRATGGAGLGLAIVTEIVSELDGQVTVSRSPWLGGARFTVSLPDART